MVLSLQMERKSGFPFAMSTTEKDPKTRLPREVTKLMQRVSSMTLEEPMRKCHRLNPYPRHGLKWKHDSSGWADTEEYWNSYDSRQAVSGNVNCSEEQDEHHNCSWFNRSSFGSFHKSKTSFWTDKDILLNWYNGGLSPPWPRIVVPIVGPKQWKQWHTWKIPAALEHFANVYGTMGVFRPSNYTFLYNSTGYIQSCVHVLFFLFVCFCFFCFCFFCVCVHILYLFIVGHFDIDLSAKIVNCTACALYTCLNHIISYHNASIALVKQRSELWLPVNLTEPWTDSVFFCTVANWV